MLTLLNDTVFPKSAMSQLTKAMSTYSQHLWYIGHTGLAMMGWGQGGDDIPLMEGVEQGDRSRGKSS